MPLSSRAIYSLTYCFLFLFLGLFSSTSTNKVKNKTATARSLCNKWAAAILFVLICNKTCPLTNHSVCCMYTCRSHVHTCGSYAHPYLDSRVKVLMWHVARVRVLYGSVLWLNVSCVLFLWTLKPRILHFWRRGCQESIAISKQKLM